MKHMGRSFSLQCGHCHHRAHVFVLLAGVWCWFLIPYALLSAQLSTPPIYPHIQTHRELVFRSEIVLNLNGPDDKWLYLLVMIHLTQSSLHKTALVWESVNGEVNWKSHRLAFSFSLLIVIDQPGSKIVQLKTTENMSEGEMLPPFPIDSINLKVESNMNTSLRCGIKQLFHGYLRGVRSPVFISALPCLLFNALNRRPWAEPFLVSVKRQSAPPFPTVR